MYMPFDNFAANAQDVKEFISQVKDSFNYAIEIYERSVAVYENPIVVDNLQFEFKIGNNNDRQAKYVLCDDSRY